MSEAVFFADVLGFRGLAREGGRGAIDALGDLAELLSDKSVLAAAGRDNEWEHRYALSDSVFLTHPDPAVAIRCGATAMFDLAYLNQSMDNPTLIRAGIGFGEVRHVRGIFMESKDPANVVGDGVIEAVEVAERSGLKGPRLLLSQAAYEEARENDADLTRRLVVPTEVESVWEVLWPLPVRPEEGDDSQILVIGRVAVRLLRAYGGNRSFGGHYREYVSLLLRCEEKLARWPAPHRAVRAPMLVDREELTEALDTTTGLPQEFRLSVQWALRR